ncbi:hypothetical protein ACFQH6_20690 [Halobacteriaceae archaeon GCM10025711]
MTKRLYRTTIPAASLTDGRQSLRRRLAKLGVIDGGTSLENIAGQPGELLLEGQYRGKYADMLAAELQELLNASGIEYVPLYSVGGSSPDDGYYATQSIDSSRQDPRAPNLTQFSGTLAKKGTRAKHWRATKTAPYQPENGTDFGNDTTGYIGVPTAASKVRWYDPSDRTLATPSVVTTRTAEGGDIDIYDAQSAPFDDPVLIYDRPYSSEGDVDVGVWDTYGRLETDSDGDFAWQEAFDPDHDYIGLPNIENGLIRIQFDEPNSSLAAWTWDDAGGSWSSVSLGAESDSTDWTVYDVNIREISPATVRVQVEFYETTGNDSGGVRYYTLDLVLPRGYTEPQWFVPQNETPPTPTGLQDKLTPIADTSVYDVDAADQLVAREEVAK